MPKKVDPKWTIVQHSAFGGDEKNEDFAKGLEPKCAATLAEQKLVETVGGMLFGSYSEADEAAFTWQYPEGVSGIIPRARGSFSSKTIGGLRIYIPVRRIVG